MACSHLEAFTRKAAIPPLWKSFPNNLVKLDLGLMTNSDQLDKQLCLCAVTETPLLVGCHHTLSLSVQTIASWFH